MIKAIIENRENRFLPYLIRWKICGTYYSNVFESKESCIDYITGKYNKVTIIDKTS